jgi:hypothetical protein
VPLYLSVSGQVDADQLAEQLGHPSWLSVSYRGTQPVAQFEHFDMLSSELDTCSGSGSGSGSDCWCMFTDDDDVWHPSRARVYADALAAALAAPAAGREPALVITGSRGRLSNGQLFAPPIEYFEYVVASSLLRDFLRDLTEHLGARFLQLRCCDLLFRNYVRCVPVHHTFDATTWLYMQEVSEERMQSNDMHLQAVCSAWYRWMERAPHLEATMIANRHRWLVRAQFK